MAKGSSGTTKDSTRHVYTEVANTDADNFFSEQTNKYINNSKNGLSDDEKKSLKEYTGSSYEEINKASKYVDNPSNFTGHNKDYLNDAKTISEALKKVTLGKDVTLHRRFGSSAMNTEIEKTFGMSIDELSKKVAKGPVTGTHKGFMSTTTDPQGYGSKKKFHYVIHAKASAHGLYVAPLSHFSYEREILFNHKQKMKATKITKEKDGRYTVYIDIE